MELGPTRGVCSGVTVSLPDLAPDLECARDSSRAPRGGSAKENGGPKAPARCRIAPTRLEVHLQTDAGFARRVDARKVELPDAVHEPGIDVVGVVEVVPPQRQLVVRVGRYVDHARARRPEVARLRVAAIG